MKAFLIKIYYKAGLDFLALLAILTGLIWTDLHFKSPKDQTKIILYDVVDYYQYLPSAFIYKDISMRYADRDVKFFKDRLYRHKTSTDKYVGKMTMGIAVLYSPFFFAAHGLAKATGYPADGFSLPYCLAIVIASGFYAMIGFIFLIRFLRKYFPRGIIALTVLAIGLGTNLYFYTTIEPGMSHAFSFFLFSVFIYLVDVWVEKPTWLYAIWIGFVGGLIILARPSNGILFIIIPLWMVDSLTAFKNRISMFLHHYLKMMGMVLIVCMVFLPQLLYWKYTTGNYFYYGYGDERFFFNDPVFIKGLFSYRKGWLVYTPIMVFSLLGIIVLYFKNRKFFWPVIVFTFLNLYIVWSWWCWWYGGGFGQRALIESYALLSIPFAAFSTFILDRKRIIKVVFLVFAFGLISLNIYQTKQYYVGVIHWDGMTKYNYWDTFFRMKISPTMYNHVENPDYEAAKNGDR